MQLIGLDDTLRIAAGGIANINRQLAVIGQNVANAGTPDYATEVSTQTSITADGLAGGVQTGALRRDVPAVLQASVFAQNADAAGLATRQAALSQVDGVQGTVGGGGDLAGLLGKLQDAFSSLQGDPSSQPAQQQVVTAANNLAGQINALSASYGAARQAAQDGITAGVAQANAQLASIGALSQQIVAARAAGVDTADLENQRDAAVDTLSSVIAVSTQVQPDGDLQVATRSGQILPTSGPAVAAGGPLVTSGATVGAAATYPGGLAGVTLGGSDVTQGLGGQVGANITLRDQTLPTWQAQLDEFAQTLSTRFDAQGLTLFTDPSGAVPAGGGTPVQSGYVGYAGTIQVNPAVLADPSLTRDGTTTVAGSATGASAFTPNPPGGPAGFTGLIGRVLSYALGSQVQDGVAQPPPATTGLGASGTLSAGFPAPSDLAGFAGTLVAAQSQDSAAAAADATTAKSVQSTLQSSLTARDGVNIDAQLALLVQLQNAYGANARVISAVQQSWTQLLASVQ